jgi:anti-anti-sigma factor
VAVHTGAQPLEIPNLLEIVTRKQGTTITIELAGEWDLAASAAARQAIASALTGLPECVVLDLSRLAFIDSTGVHATFELAQRSKAQHIRLVIIPGPPAVQRIFELTGLNKQLPFINEQPPGRAARPRSARDRAAGSGGSSLPANRAGRRPPAAGAAPTNTTPPSPPAPNPPTPRRQHPIPTQPRSHLSAVPTELAQRRQSDG